MLSAVWVQVRIAACAALVAFVRSAGSSYCVTNSGYLAAGVVVHMDDTDTQVAEAACQVGGLKSLGLSTRSTALQAFPPREESQVTACAQPAEVACKVGLLVQVPVLPNMLSVLSNPCVAWHLRV
jgi:hypothetical protein